nr:hypothetical protein [bacterium]
GHLGDRSIKKPVEHFAEGGMLPVKVIKVDHDGRRIVLSVTDRLREEGSEALAEYMDKYGETRFPGATEEPEFDAEVDDASPVVADEAPEPVAETAEAPEAEEAAAPEAEEAPLELADSDEEDKEKPEQA